MMKFYCKKFSEYSLKASLFFALLMGVFSFGSSLQAQEIPDPCPIPSTLAQESPPDMASVQSDIDILSLCVERARLLEQLNNLVQQMSGSFPANTPAPPMGLKTTPPRANADLFDLPPVEEPNFEEEMVIQEDVVEEAPAPKASWKIRKISGNQKDGVIAELKSADGTSVRAKRGDTLSDGSIVKDVSVLGVVLSIKGEEKNLDWE